MLYLKGLILLVFAAVSIAASVLDPSTLVIYDPKLTDLETYSKLLESLRQRSYQLTIKTVNDKIKLYKNDEKLYQNVIIFPTKLRTIGEEITGAKLLEFFNDGGDIYTISSPDGLSEAVRTFVNQLGIYPSPRNHQLLDHFNHEESSENKHDVVKLNGSNVVDNQAIIQSIGKDEGFSYKGSSAILGNGRLITPVIQAPSTSFSKDLKNDDYVLENNWSVGSQGYLAVAFQGMNNARAFWIGSDEFLNDANNEAVNAKLIEDSIKWTFQETKVIKATSVEHYHSDGTSYEDRPYKIKDDIIYKIGISEWDGESWKPFIADDVQVEIKLLDPYHRLNLKPVATEGESTIYGVEFKLPDHHGVFSFHTNYRRPGFSYIDEKNTLAIRHLANDEYPRSWDITNSWVYITSGVVVFVAWIAFVVLFIYSSDETSSKVEEAKKEK